MGGDIIRPGDLHGRVLPANEVELCWDGNQISALVGPDLVVGVSGFGDAVHDALRELADNLIKEAVWVEIPDKAELRSVFREATNSSIHTNAGRLYRKDSQICAFVGTEDSDIGVSGFGDSVHDAIRDLAGKLVEKGVWVEVTDRREWHIEEPDEIEYDDEQETSLAHTAWGAPDCAGKLVVLTRGNQADIVCAECQRLVYKGAAGTIQATLERMERTRITTIPHSSFGAEDCCGCLDAAINGDQATIRCNECDALIRTVPVADLERTLSEMELALDCRTEMCPHCKKVNVISGFTELLAYTCCECGELVRLSDDPEIDRIFGSP